MTKTELWQDITLEEGSQHEQLIGELFFRVMLETKELWIGYAYRESETESADSLSDEVLEWTRWTFSDPPRQLQLRPYLPDMPMVVYSEYPQRILPGDEARIFVGIPATLRFNLLKKKEQTLIELPTENLSRTWFGDRLEGELCYWWSTRARRKMPEMQKETNRVGCPVWLQNKSDEELYFDKFCHRVARLHIYQLNGGLWSDETQIVYKGSDNLSDITTKGRLPDEIRNAEKIADPRDPIRKSFATRTFLRFI